MVDRERLVESSSVYRYIIEEFWILTEHDMNDFWPKIFELFLTLLLEGRLEQLEDRDFREIVTTQEFDIVSFLFGECYYIHNKCKVADLMELLILELRFQDTTLFLSHYLRENCDQLFNYQLKFL